MKVGKPKALKPPNRSAIGAVDVSPDGRCFVLGQDAGKDGEASLTLWSLGDLEPVRDLATRTFEFVLAARFSPNGKTIAYTDTGDLEARICGLTDEEAVDTRLDTPGVTWLTYAAKRNRLLVSGAKTQVWEPADGTLVWTAPGGAHKDPDNPRPLGALAPAGKSAAVAGLEKGEIAVFELDGDRVRQRLEQAPDHARCVAVDPTGRYLGAVEWNSHGDFLWDLKSGKRVESDVVNEEAEGAWCLRFHPDGEHVAVGMVLGWVLLVRISDGEVLLDEEIHDGRVWDVAFSPDGKRLLSAGEDGVVQVWSLG